MEPFLAFGVGGAAVLAAGIGPLRARLRLSRAKHASLQGHARLSKALARLVPFYEFDDHRFFDSDGAPAEVAARRREGFSRVARRLRDLDGNFSYDLTGSYGVNVFGYDFYKDCIERGAPGSRARARCSALPPVVADNVARLRAISGLDEVSFHMSGTEAVMQAVRLARYHTGARTWCASAAPTTAGGATCSPASATRWPPRDLHAEGHGRGHARVLAHAAGHRLRAGQPAAGAAPQRRRAGRLDAVDSSAGAGFDRDAPTPRGCSDCARSARSAASC
jgi:glutamate-1-semialdehyde 2,1-aminomutase